MKPRGIYIALGSNLGDREGHIRGALEELAARPDISVVRGSTLHETEPVGGPADQPRYLNAVAEIETALEPRPLLVRLQEIESEHGRTRNGRNEARTLDLDLLLYHDRRINEPDLAVPHPRMWERPFVLEPLREVCPPEQLAAFMRRFGVAPTGMARDD